MVIGKNAPSNVLIEKGNVRNLGVGLQVENAEMESNLRIGGKKSEIFVRNHVEPVVSTFDYIILS